MTNVFMRYYKEMFIAYWPLGESHIKMFSLSHNQMSLYIRVVRAEPAIAINDLLNFRHLVIYSQTPAHEVSATRILHSCICRFLGFILYKNKVFSSSLVICLTNETGDGTIFG